MTKTIFVTDLTEVMGIKIVCECGAQWTIPIDGQPPKSCFSCNKEMPWKEINRAVKGIQAISQSSKDHAFGAFIETEQP